MCNKCNNLVASVVASAEVTVKSVAPFQHRFNSAVLHCRLMEYAVLDLLHMCHMLLLSSAAASKIRSVLGT